MNTFNHNIRHYKCTVSSKCRNYCTDYMRPIGSFRYSDHESIAGYSIYHNIKNLKNNHHVVHKMHNRLDFRSRGVTPIVRKSYKIGGEYKDVW